MANMVLKNLFPFLKSSCGLVYLDSAATSLLFGGYLKVLEHLVSQGFTTVHRGVNQLADKTTVAYEAARAEIAALHAVSPQEIVFTSGTTAACNQVAWSWGMQHLQADDEILVSIFEHHSSYLPWRKVSEHKGAVIRWVKPESDGLLWKESDFCFSSKTKVLVISAYSNVCGPVWSSLDDLKRVIRRAQAQNVCVIVDGAQQAPFEKVNLRDLNPDFYMYSAHKMCGPQGVGVLFVNQKIRDIVAPALVGGGTVSSVTQEKAAFLPDGRAFEPGTPPVLPVIAWCEAQQELLKLFDLSVEQQRLAGLVGMVIDAVHKIPGVRVLGNEALLKKSGHLISFVVDGVHAHDLADELNTHNIMVRAGLMCAQPLHEFLGVTASLRVSLHVYSTQDDVERFTHAFMSAVARLREV